MLPVQVELQCLHVFVPYEQEVAPFPDPSSQTSPLAESTSPSPQYDPRTVTYPVQVWLQFRQETWPYGQ